MNKQPSPLLIGSTFGGAVIIMMIVALLAPVNFSVRVEPKVAGAQSATQAATQSPVTTVSNTASNTVSNTAKTLEYTLRTALGGTPAMSFVGVGGDIDGKVNPDLTANVGDTVNITVINSDPVAHDFNIDELKVKSEQLTQKDQKVTVTFTPTRPGDFAYFCSLPGHRQTGMEGKLHITGTAVAQSDMAGMSGSTASTASDTAPTVMPMKAEAAGVWAIRNPADLPAPVGNREPQTVKVSLTAKEVTAQLADGVSYTFFTFDGKIPGPMLRGRVGDTIEITLHNDKSSTMPHSIDLHAVNGPGGGAVYTQTNPDGTNTFSFKALNPGIYVYHCATPSVAHHIQSGMYGLILIEPEGGLPKVDKEFYVMQGEVYTDSPFGTKGHMNFDDKKMLNETPEYFMFNGASGALTKDDYALRAKVGETVRIFFGVGGPNFTSSFHVIGEIFDRVYDQGSITSQPLTNVQTTSVPPGAATIVEFKLNVPGRYILVDHALSRMERGLAGYLYAEGDADKSIIDGTLTSGSGH